MAQENIVFYNPMDELDEDLNINLKKIWMILWSRKWLLVKVFWSIMALFILLFFVTPKKYVVTADLYVNKSNSSNLTEFNPYVLDEAAGALVSMGADKAMNNEIELMKSSLVLDKVIQENNIIYRKKYGIIPNSREGEYIPAKAFYGKGKILKFENVKNTSVISISYKAKDPKFAYNIVTSLIKNYIELHKEINTEKSKSDKQLLEAEYAQTKANLDKKLKQSTGLPEQSMGGIANLSAMSAFSRSASSAIGNLKSQYIAGERSQIAISEETQKLTQLATKLEWAKIVEHMSDSSKVIVLHEPRLLNKNENSSPKLLINIILGFIFGGIASLMALIYVEIKSKKLTYSMLTNNIIFDGTQKLNIIEDKCYGYDPKKVLLLSFVQLPNAMIDSLQKLPNTSVTYYSSTKDYMNKIKVADKIVLASKIEITDAETYKTIRETIKNQQKEIIFDILM